jgi:hypothetical protein
MPGSNGTEWVNVECPVCRDTFVQLRRGTNIRGVEVRNLRHKNGSSVNKRERRQCDSCGIAPPTSGVILLITGTARKAVQ